MADFDGFKCDACGEVWDAEKRTKVYLRYEQTPYCELGTYKRDLCPRCVAPPFDWEPLRSKTRATQLREPEPTATIPDSEPREPGPVPDPNQPGVGGSTSSDPYGRGFPSVPV